MKWILKFMLVLCMDSLNVIDVVKQRLASPEAIGIEEEEDE